MSIPETPPVEARRPSATPWLILALVVILAALAVYFLTAKAAPALDPVAYLPKDCAYAVTFDFTSTPDKQAAADVIRDIFKDAGIDDPEAELIKKLNKKLGLDFEKDVWNRLSLTGSVGAFATAKAGKPGMLLVVGTKSEEDATALLGIVRDEMAKHKEPPESAGYGGFTYYRLKSRGDARSVLGAVRNAILFASNEEAFKKAVDTVKGDQPSLLEDASFQGTRKTTPATFASFYYSGPNYFKFLQSMAAEGEMGVAAPLIDMFKDLYGAQKAAAGSAEASAEGIRMEGTEVHKGAAIPYTAASLEELAATAPEDAAVAVAMNGVDKMWQYVRNILLSKADVKYYLEARLAQLRAEIGFDLFADLLDRITGVSAYYVPARPATPDGCPGDIVFTLSVDKPAVVGAALKKMQAAIATKGILVPQMDVGGAQVCVVPAPTDKVRMAFALAGNKLVFCMTGSDLKAALGNALATAEGRRTDLTASGGFRMVQKDLPTHTAGLLFIDATPIIETFRSDMSPDDRKIADAIAKRIGPLAAGMEVSGGGSRSTLVIPFKR